MRLESMARTAAVVAVLAAAAWSGQAPAAGQAASPAKPGRVKLAHKFTLKGAGEIQQSSDGVASELKLSKVESGGLMTLLDETWNASFAVIPHYHETHDEVFYILAGQIEWTVGGEKHVMNAGDSVFIPRGTVHSTKVVGGKDARTLMLYFPGGYEEHQRREAKYTAQQLEDPKVKALLRKLNDFHPADVAGK